MNRTDDRNRKDSKVKSERREKSKQKDQRNEKGHFETVSMCRVIVRHLFIIIVGCIGVFLCAPAERKKNRFCIFVKV